MKTVKALEFARLLVAGGIIGTAIAGTFFNGANVQFGTIDLNVVGALVGAAFSAVFVKAIHLV